MGINYQFLPNVIVGVRWGSPRRASARPSRCASELLRSIGGLRGVHRPPGRRLRDRPRRARPRPAHGGARPSSSRHTLLRAEPVASCWRHELRWARTIRTLDPSAIAGAIVTHALPLALIGMALGGVDASQLARAWPRRWPRGCRLKWRMDRVLAHQRRAGLAAARCATAVFRRVPWLAVRRQSSDWRGSRFLVAPDGVLSHWQIRYRIMMRTLFLQAPSFDGFDGGAGSRYQAKREIKSFWYPTWLAQPAALVENSKLIDAPPHKTKLAEVAAQAKDFDLVVLHTSVPSFKSDVKMIEALKAANPNAEDRHDRRQGRGRMPTRASLQAPGRSTSSPATSSTSPSRKSPTARTGRRSRACPSATTRASSSTTRIARSWRTWTRCPSSRRSTSATW